MSTLGIQQSQEIVKFVGVFLTAVGKSLEDGKFSLMDLANFMSVVNSSGAALKDAQLALAELQDLDEAELGQLVGEFKLSFDLKNQAMEDTIEGGLAYLKYALTIWDLVKPFLKK